MAATLPAEIPMPRRSVGLSLRLTPTLLARLARVAHAHGRLLSKAKLAALALEEGLTRIEADPALLVASPAADDSQEPR